MISKRQKRWMLMAVGIFLSTSLMAIFINSLSYGWHWNYSISRYVGLETWSAVLFALGNIVVAVLFGKYLYTVSETWQMSRWFYYLIVVVAVALIGLSVCPIGYFDPSGAKFGSSLPSQIHQFCSRLMFVCMLLIALALQSRDVVSKPIRWWCRVYVVYGILCAMGYFWEWGWFFRSMLVFEGAYILGFMVLCWRLQENKTTQERSLDGGAKTGN